MKDTKTILINALFRRFSLVKFFIFGVVACCLFFAVPSCTQKKPGKVECTKVNNQCDQQNETIERDSGNGSSPNKPQEKELPEQNLQTKKPDSNPELVYNSKPIQVKECKKVSESYSEKVKETSITPKDMGVFESRVIPRNSNIYDRVQKEIAEKGIETGYLILRLSYDTASIAYALATLSPYSHIGIVLRKDGGDILVLDYIPNYTSGKAEIGLTDLQTWIDKPTGGKVPVVSILRPTVAFKGKYKNEKERYRYLFDVFMNKEKHKKELLKKVSTQKKKLQIPLCSEFVREIMEEMYFEKGYQLADFSETAKEVAWSLIGHAEGLNPVDLKKNIIWADLLKNAPSVSDFLGGYLSAENKLVTPSSFEWSHKFEHHIWKETEDLFIVHMLYGHDLTINKLYAIIEHYDQSKKSIAKSRAKLISSVVQDRRTNPSWTKKILSEQDKMNIAETFHSLSYEDQRYIERDFLYLTNEEKKQIEDIYRPIGTFFSRYYDETVFISEKAVQDYFFLMASDKLKTIKKIADFIDCAGNIDNLVYTSTQP